jgi:hypothetical protein
LKKGGGPCHERLWAKSKDGDYHQEMNSIVFLEWFENQMMPALKNPSLVVLEACNSAGLKIVPLLASSTFIAPYFHYVIQTRTCIHS